MKLEREATIDQIGAAQLPNLSLEGTLNEPRLLS